MSKGRLEAFSDGVIAIIITIMVLEVKVPHETSLEALRPMVAPLLCYILSFTFVGIYWNNHHHMIHAVQKVNGGILWANLHLLFWLSLVPLVTEWMGENRLVPVTAAVYGFVLLMAGFAFHVLAGALIKYHGEDSPLAKAIGARSRGKASVALYALAILLAVVNPWISVAIYVLVAIMWFVPDRRIEKVLAE